MAFPTACFPKNNTTLQGAGFVGRLDAYASFLTAALSPAERLLTSYTGPLLRVRRGSDNAEMDVYALGRYADVATPLAWAGGSGLWVKKVYDQIASYDFTQSTASVQPTLETAWSGLNNRAAARFEPSPTQNLTTSLSLNATPYSIALVEQATASSGSTRTITSSNGGTNFLISAGRSDGAGPAYYAGAISAGVGSLNAQFEILTAPSGGNFKFYQNGTDVTTGSIGSGGWGNPTIADGYFHEPAKAVLSHLMFFNKALSAGEVSALYALFNPSTL